jgi:hypothetical protein
VKLIDGGVIDSGRSNKGEPIVVIDSHRNESDKRLVPIRSIYR